MTSKKDNILCFRLDDEMLSLLRRVSDYNCISVGSLVRRVLLSYFVKKGLLKK